jgi:hypothetical protein
MECHPAIDIQRLWLTTAEMVDWEHLVSSSSSSAQDLLLRYQLSSTVCCFEMHYALIETKEGMVDRMKFYFESQQDRLFDGLLGQA